MEQMFNVSSNPHVRARMTTAKIMQLVVIALLPAALMGIYNHWIKGSCRSGGIHRFSSACRVVI